MLMLSLFRLRPVVCEDATGLPGGVSRCQLQTAGTNIPPIARPLPKAAAGQSGYDDRDGDWLCVAANVTDHRASRWHGLLHAVAEQNWDNAANAGRQHFAHASPALHSSRLFGNLVMHHSGGTVISEFFRGEPVIFSNQALPKGMFRSPILGPASKLTPF